VTAYFIIFHFFNYY